MALKIKTLTAGERAAPGLMTEGDLRTWLKAVWPAAELHWTEAGRGGTVGLPDVSIPVYVRKKGLPADAWRLPCELKLWKRTRKGVNNHLRPAQIRFHVLEARAGRRTAIMAAVQDYEDEPFSLVVIPGHACPVEPYEQLRGRWFKGAGAECRSEMKTKLCDLFNSETFWSR